VDSPTSSADEQLRRLKNTIMGAGYRLGQLARSGQLPDQATGELVALSQALTDAALRLERLLAAVRQRG
jgi:hypothetical protein